MVTTLSKETSKRVAILMDKHTKILDSQPVEDKMGIFKNDNGDIAVYLGVHDSNPKIDKWKAKWYDMYVLRIKDKWIHIKVAYANGVPPQVVASPPSIDAYKIAHAALKSEGGEELITIFENLIK